MLAKPMITPCSVNDCVKPDLESKVPIAERLPWGVAEPLIEEADVCATGAILSGTLEPPKYSGRY